MNFLPGWSQIMASAGGATSLAFQASASSENSATVTGPASIQSGDLLCLSDRGFEFLGFPTTAAPSGFTSIENVTVDPDTRHIISYKIADGSEASSSLTGMTFLGGGKVLFVLRPDNPITNVNIQDSDSQGTAGNPASQTVTSSGGAVPLVVLGAYGSFNNAIAETFTPTEDGSVEANGDGGDAGDEANLFAYKIYNSSPANVTIDMPDEGASNTLLSCYLECS